jgi:hypothetical protein
MQLCNFMRFKRRDGSYTEWAAQNFFAGQTRNFRGASYRFIPIAVATNASTRGGDRAEAAISAPAGEITSSVFKEAADEDWLLEIKTVKINTSDFSIDDLLMTELWSCSQVQYDISQDGVVLQLASPLDSVTRIGGRFLSQSLVGALPTSGTLTLQ